MMDNKKINLEWIPNAYAAGNDISIGEKADAMQPKNIAPNVRSNTRMSANKRVVKTRRNY